MRFFINLRSSVIRHCCECRNLIYHKNLLCQARFLIFSSFLSACPALHELVMRRRTRHNISPEFILSNHFEQKICFFLQKSCPTRKRVGAGVYAGNVMATVVCETAGARRLFMDQVDLMDQMDKMGAPRDTPRVCSAAVGWDAGGRFTAGVCFACLIATVVCRLRRRGACVGPVGPV